MKYLFLIPSLVLLISGSHASPLIAAKQVPATMLLAEAGTSLKQAIRSLKQKTGGRILSARTVSEKGKRIHKIKVLLPSGKVRVFKVSAN